MAKNSCGASLENSHGVFWDRINFIGEGSFASVFLAKRRTPINEEIKFPLLMAVKSATMDRSLSLMYEKQVLSNLSTSPYIVQCYGDEITKTSNGVKIYNLLIEFCSGNSLYDQISVFCCGLPESMVKNYTRDILRGLDHIHRYGYVHRDIKLDNILLVPGNGKRSGKFVAKIAYFGFAKPMHEVEEHSSEMQGSKRYMPPEVVRGKKLEYSSDIWSLGCVVLEMLTAKCAWNCLNDNELTRLIGYTDRIPDIPSDLSEDAKDFLHRCFDRNGATRLSAVRLLEHPFVYGDD